MVPEECALSAPQRRWSARHLQESQQSPNDCLGLVLTSRLGLEPSPGSKPDSNEYPSCIWVCCILNHMKGLKHPPAGVMRKFGEVLPAQASTSSSDAVR
ncbi:hypothetical protein AVEN_82803-1 [Araneus ventricosus]|uniref:Uncharacterized protein n=1 Tax=Araneus ventricosus TaxID=182803 RepID=A0A4Y2DDA3_ARAVE|nr:hypothetical protein AVEN_82803-1 [Araneus ventricosus]